jgi:hypothetical protein
MKSINTMAAVAILALSSVGLASAQTYHVTGSTAYRVADVSAEVSIVGATGKATYYGSSLTGANYSVVTNSTGSLKFENYFNGSIAGDEALVGGVTKLPFPAATSTGETPTGPLTVYSGATAASGGRALSSVGSDTDVAFPDIAYSDVSFDTAQQIIFNSTDSTTTVPANNGLTSSIVGVVPFAWVINGSTDVIASSGSFTGLSMTPQAFNTIWGGGSYPFSLLTGVNTDTATTVYALGRDADSGTRATALAETGYGLLGSGIVTTPVVQYYPYQTATQALNDTLTGVIGLDSSTSGQTIGGLNGVPNETIDGYTQNNANGGYNSGGNLATAVSTTFAPGTTNTVLVTYLGASDAKSALTASGTNRTPAYQLGYNGTTFLVTPASTTNSNLIYYGRYTFWGYEHLYYVTSHVSGLTGSTGIAAQLENTLIGGADQLSSNGVTFAGLKVQRSDDGQSVQ